jgi:hypothetical protein
MSEHSVLHYAARAPPPGVSGQATRAGASCDGRPRSALPIESGARDVWGSVKCHAA